MSSYRFGTSIRVLREDGAALSVHDKSAISAAWEKAREAVENHIGSVWQFELALYPASDENGRPGIEYRFSTYHFDEAREPDESVEQILARERFVGHHIGSIMAQLLGEPYDVGGWTGELSQLG